MQGKGPLGRKRNVTGKASNSSMQTHQSAPQQGGGASRPQQQRPGAFQQQPQRPQGQRAQQGGSPFGQQRGTTRGGGSPLLIIVILAVLLLGGGGGLGGLFGGGDSSSNNGGSSSGTGVSDILGGLLGGGEDSSSGTAGGSSLLEGASSLLGGGGSSILGNGGASMLGSLLGGSWYADQTGAAATVSPAASQNANSSSLDRTVASGSRSKYTKLKGNGRDTFTIMVYMCGADLESRSAMATKDLQEMLKATYGSNVRLIVYTGGSTKWQNNLVSASRNQIWQLADGKMNCLVDNAGTASMTDPGTLASFIQYCAKNFSASRYALILWDHGSGSVSGYGYDEKNPRSGSMSLAGLNTAFQNGGVKFDFVGFDTCLMATVENALMLSKYADYMIASEETEPGIGWYYTDWLTAVGKNTSLPTLDIGRQICDDFVSACASQCRGQSTTLSVVDLAELENTIPAKLTDFSRSITSLITNKEYRAVSSARNGSREFAASSRIDQVDLSDLCDHLGTDEGAVLARALRSAVKYNRTNMTNAYGLSVYLPYQKVSNVEKAANTYAAIGMDDSYAEAIRAFASVEAGGQAVTGGANTAIPSLFGGGYGGSSSSGDMIGSLLSAFLGSGDLFSGRGMDEEAMAAYLSDHMLDTSALVFAREGDQYVLDLPAEQWALVNGADLNVFYHNGDGYVDLGLDNVFEFDQAGRMIADTSGAWVAINGQPVAYYHETSESWADGSWRITGRVPALLDGVRTDLLIVYDQDHENGYVAGARTVYTQGETDTVAKSMETVEQGARIVFLADLYNDQQQFIDSYELGDPITVSGELTVSDVELPDTSKVMATYRFTDLYNQAYWTPVIGR